jgi:hypothetical protein
MSHALLGRIAQGIGKPSRDLVRTASHVMITVDYNGAHHAAARRIRADHHPHNQDIGD